MVKQVESLKISELIRVLQEFKRLKGDLLVLSSCDEPIEFLCLENRSYRQYDEDIGLPEEWIKIY